MKIYCTHIYNNNYLQNRQTLVCLDGQAQSVLGLLKVRVIFLIKNVTKYEGITFNHKTERLQNIVARYSFGQLGFSMKLTHLSPIQY